MAIQSNFPAIRPSLNLDFANAKTLDPRITFARESTATFYDGKTFAKAEENLLLHSQAINTGWSKTLTTAADNNAVAPDGTTTASLITSTSAGPSRVGLQLTPSAFTVGASYVLSVFAKAGTHDIIQLAGIAGLFTDNGQAIFDLTNGVLGTVAGGTATITAVGNGWYRCSWVVTAASASGTIYITLVNTTTASRFDSTGIVIGDSVSLWGAQLEQRGTVTAYTPTTTQPITNYIPQLMTAAANVARFDHSPVTGESLGLLIEEQRTNLLTYSAEFGDAAWTKTGIAVASENASVAPDGTLSANQIAENTSLSSHAIRRSFAFAASTAYTASFYLKAGARTAGTFLIFDNASNIGSWHINLLTGELVQGTAGLATTATATNAGNGWWRVAVAFTSTASPSSSYFDFRLSNVWPVASTTGSSYTGDGYSGIYIWGAQLEAGAFPTSYIPTVAAQATRNADAALMTGANFSSWYRQSEGTLYADAAFGNGMGSVAQTVCSVSDGGEVNRLISYRTNTVAYVFEETPGGGSIAVGASANNTRYLTAVAYKTNDMALSINGAAATTDTSVTISTKSQINIGDRAAGSRGLNGHIRKLAYYPARLTNSQLQALTS